MHTNTGVPLMSVVMSIRKSSLLWSPAHRAFPLPHAIAYWKKHCVVCAAWKDDNAIRNTKDKCLTNKLTNGNQLGFNEDAHLFLGSF